MSLMIFFIRNAAAKGGEEGRFPGRGDEPLTPESESLLRQRTENGIYTKAHIVFSGGTTRCLQTASIIYPKMPAIVLRELAPFDYGVFSGCTYGETVMDRQFAQWAESSGLPAFPGGEEPLTFAGRCARALRHITMEAHAKGIGHVGIITHLCVIKTILHRYCVPRSFYRDLQLDYCEGCSAIYNPQTAALRIAERF